MTLEDYLRKQVAAGATSFHVRAHATGGEGLPSMGGRATSFRIQPVGRDAEPECFIVTGDYTESVK